MAYCKECGAYIPDGKTKCLACGKDMNETRQAEAYEYSTEAKRFDTEYLRQQLEQQRKRQQENSRKWAETEKEQRERARNRNESYYSASRSTDFKKYDIPTSYSKDKVLSVLSYFGFLFVLPYVFCDKDGFAQFHAKQGMILFIAGWIAKALASVLGLGWIVDIAKLWFIYKGVRNVLEGKREALPYIGSLI